MGAGPVADPEKPPGPAGDYSPPAPPPQYGTFAEYSQPAIGFPQPAPPAGFYSAGPGAAGGYHVSQPLPAPVIGRAVAGGRYPSSEEGYAPLVDGRPVRLHRLPCCGIGIGWFLFIAGFIFPALPWYVGAFMQICVRVDYREKPGLVACTIAAIISVFAILVGATKGGHMW